MDLKRAWRNGFLVSLIFAIPLSDLYYSRHTNLIIDNHSGKSPVQHAKNCGTACAGFENSNSRHGDIASKTPSRETDADGNGLAIPEGSLKRMLLESGDTDFSDIRKARFQFDPQDIFQSIELIDEFDPDATGTAQQIIDTNIGAIASLSYGFGESKAYAPGFSGPFMPAAFAPGGKTGSAALQNAIGGDSTTPFVEPLPGSSTPTETIVTIDTPTGDTNTGIDDESLHTVPEPPLLILMTIGTISVAALLYRNSKPPTIHS